MCLIQMKQGHNMASLSFVYLHHLCQAGRRLHTLRRFLHSYERMLWHFHQFYLLILLIPYLHYWRVITSIYIGYILNNFVTKIVKESIFRNYFNSLWWMTFF